MSLVWWWAYQVLGVVLTSMAFMLTEGELSPWSPSMVFGYGASVRDTRPWWRVLAISGGLVLGWVLGGC